MPQEGTIRGTVRCRWGPFGLLLFGVLGCERDAVRDRPEAHVGTAVRPTSIAPEPVDPVPVEVAPAATAMASPARRAVLPPRVPTCEATEIASQPVMTQAGLVFREVRGAPLALDLVTPVGGARNTFTVVLVHGGGWRRGERAHFGEEAARLAAMGFGAATVDYRLSPETQFPGAVSDVRCALRYLSAEAERLGIDGSRLIPLGSSAGGHLVALAALAPDDPSLDDVPCPYSEPVHVMAWVAYFAPFDLTHGEAWPPATRRVADLFLGDATLAVARAASPVLHVSQAAPPALLFHSVEDPVVPVIESEAMTAALEAYGVPVRFVPVPGAVHGFRMFSQNPLHRPSVCTLKAFLELNRR